MKAGKNGPPKQVIVKYCVEIKRQWNAFKLQTHPLVKRTETWNTESMQVASKQAGLHESSTCEHRNAQTRNVLEKIQAKL